MAPGQVAARHQSASLPRFAAIRVRAADGAPQRIGSRGVQHMPGAEGWLVGDHRSLGERKCHLSNWPADTAIRKLAGSIKARWNFEHPCACTPATRGRTARPRSLAQLNLWPT